MAQSDRVPNSEWPQRPGQLGRPWHLSVVDKNGNDPDAALEGRADFDADEIARLIEASLTRVIGGRQPLRADDREQHIAARDGGLDLADEVGPGRNFVYIHEDASLTEARLEVVVEPTGRVRGVFTTVADENRRHRCRLKAASLGSSQARARSVRPHGDGVNDGARQRALRDFSFALPPPSQSSTTPLPVSLSGARRRSAQRHYEARWQRNP
jgi:hypothetical protein